VSSWGACWLNMKIETLKVLPGVDQKLTSWPCRLWSIKLFLGWRNNRQYVDGRSIKTTRSV
jgi:hypothetical protein